MSVGWWLRDTLEMVRRNLLHIRRTPELLLDVTVQPVMFVVLFRFVFGGAIQIAGDSYVNYLMAGIFVQTVAFAGVYTGVLLANDLKNGMIDRFRSLPMSQASVLTGRTMTDLLRAMLAVAVMWGIGSLVGFSPQGGVGGALAAVGIMLAFGFALSWLGVAMGAWVRTPEALQGLIFTTIFPLTFASSAFVPTDTMPDWLRVFAENQPMTRVINAVRDLILGGSGGPDLVPALIWSLGALFIFFPLALWLYRRRISQ